MPHYGYDVYVTSWDTSRPEDVHICQGDLPKNASSFDVTLIHGKKATVALTEGYRVDKDGNKIAAPGGLILVETAQRLAAGQETTPPQHDETRLELGPPFEGTSMRLVLRRRAEQRHVDGPPGKKCSRCQWFDRKEGHEALTKATHKGFSNGEYCFPDVVARALASEFQAPYLHPDEVGYCPRQRALLHESCGACKEYKEIKINWFRRIVRWFKGE